MDYIEQSVDFVKRCFLLAAGTLLAIVVLCGVDGIIQHFVGR